MTCTDENLSILVYSSRSTPANMRNGMFTAMGNGVPAAMRNGMYAVVRNDMFAAMRNDLFAVARRGISAVIRNGMFFFFFFLQSLDLFLGLPPESRSTYGWFTDLCI